MSAGPKKPEMYSYEEIVGFVEQGSETEVVLKNKQGGYINAD